MNQALLQRHCQETILADIVTYADLESRMADLFLCVQAHNRDKARIEMGE